jgi:hypothetical protein
VVLLEELGHLALEVKAAQENEMSVIELLPITGAGDVLVRVHTCGHERFDLDSVTTHALHDIGDDGGGADDPDRWAIELWRALSARAAQKTEAEDADYDNQDQTS